MPRLRPLTVLLALTLTANARSAEARRSGSPGHYIIRCVAAECSDRYHYRAPRGERAYRSTFGRSHRSRY